MQGGYLVHEFLVDGQAAGGVYNDGVKAVFPCVDERLLGGLYRILRAFFEHGAAGLFAYDLQLPDGGGTVDVAGDEQRVLALLFEPQRELRRMCRFARALEPAHQYDSRRARSRLELGDAAAHKGNEFFVYYFYYLLRGEQTFEHFVAHGAFRHFGDEILYHFKVDVRFEQGELYIAHAGLDVGFGELALVPELFQRGGHFFH